MTLIEAAQEANRKKREREWSRLRLWLRIYLLHPKRRTLKAFIAEARWEADWYGNDHDGHAQLTTEIDGVVLEFTRNSYSYIHQRASGGFRPTINKLEDIRA